MSVPFPIRVELALDADLTADPGTWSWNTDISDWVLAEDGVRIRRGRSDWQSQAEPSWCTLTLNNSDGRFSRLNPLGVYYGRLRKNTPIRVSISPDGGSTFSVRFVGFLSELPVTWDPSEAVFRTVVRADGILRRLGQGSSPLRSALYRATAGINPNGYVPVAYWPLEEGADATTSTAAIGGGTLAASGAVSFGSDTSAAGSEALPTLAAGGIVRANVSSYTAVDRWFVQMVFSLAAEPAADTTYVYIDIAGGAIAKLSLRVEPGSPATIWLDSFLADGSSDGNVGAPLSGVGPANPTEAEIFGRTLMLTIALSEEFAPGTPEGFFNFYDGDGNALASAGLSHTGAAGRVSGIRVVGPGITVGHIAVFAANFGQADLVYMADAMGGFAGELAGARFTRLCGEENIPSDVRGPDLTTYAMGAQGVGTLLDLLRECEASSAGVIAERRTGELGLDLNSYRENLAVALALDYAQRHIAALGAPADDDQAIRNDVTVIAAGGSGTRVVDEGGSLGVVTVGRYDEQVIVSLDPDDPDLPLHHAAWRINIGTGGDQYHYPLITLGMYSPQIAGLRTATAATDISSRVTVKNLPNKLPPDLVDLVVDGGNERADGYIWDIDLICSPYRPFKVFDISADTPPDLSEWAGRLAADPAAAIRTAVSSSATSIDVDPNFYRFTTVADHFDPDLDLRFGGELVSVSSISTTAATYVGRGAMSSADNAAVSPATTGFGAADGDLLCCLGRIRGTAGSLSATAGWDLMAQVGKLYLWGQIRSGTTPITLTPSGGAAGDTVSATVFALHNMPVTVDPSELVLEVLPQSNASAQDIAFPGILPFYEGTVVFLLAGKSDDWTSVAVPAGYTESGEPTTTTGNDQSLYLAYQIQTTPALVEGGSAVVTGGAAAVSESMVVSLAAGYQTLTVSARSVNGVAKAQSAGTLVEVEDALPLAL